MTRRVSPFTLAVTSCVVGLLAGTLALGARPVAAQTPSAALSVTPPTASIDAAPNSTATQTIGIDNISDEDREISTEVQNFSAAEEQGQPALSSDDGPYALAQWIKVSPASARIAAHQRQEFKITINVPANAPPGGHYGAIVFSPSTDSSGGTLSVVSRVTSLLLLRVPGDVKESAKLTSFSACHLTKGATTCEKNTKFFQDGPINFTSRVTNEGNVHVSPSGTITIKNVFDKKVADLKVDPKVVLPDSTRRLEASWKSKSPFGIYKIETDLKYGTTSTELRASKTIVVIPIVKVVVIIGGLAILFFLFWLPRKRLKKAFQAFKNAG